MHHILFVYILLNILIFWRVYAEVHKKCTSERKEKARHAIPVNLAFSSLLLMPVLGILYTIALFKHSENPK